MSDAAAVAIVPPPGFTEHVPDPDDRLAPFAMGGLWRCQTCGRLFGPTNFARLVLQSDEHVAHHRHGLHVVLNRRARDRWVPVAEGVLVSARARGHAVEFEGAYPSRGRHHPAPFVARAAVEDVAHALPPARLVARFAALLLAASDRVRAHAEPWHVAWPHVVAAQVPGASEATPPSDLLFLVRDAWWR